MVNKYVAATLQRILPHQIEDETFEGETIYIDNYIHSRIKVTAASMLESPTRKLLNPDGQALTRKTWFAWQKLEMPDWTIFELHKENEVST